MFWYESNPANWDVNVNLLNVNVNVNSFYRTPMP